MGETVLDLAETLTTPAGSQPAPGDKYGVSADAVTGVDNLWQKFSTAVGAPQGARAKRKALTHGLPGQFSAVEQQFRDLDDLVVQFRDNNGGAGDQFVAAWFNARHVSDLGIRHAAPPAPAPTPATAGK